MQEDKYIIVGKLDSKLLSKIGIKLTTDEVILTYERLNHVESKRAQLYNNIQDILQDALRNPEYIYQDWNNRSNTIILIKSINENYKINIVIKVAVLNDIKHTKNSIITMMKIGKKTFYKILKNKQEKILYKRLDICE